MSDRNELFPFPIVEHGAEPGKPSDTAAPLPGFPEPARPPEPLPFPVPNEEVLSGEDIRDLHRILEAYRAGSLPMKDSISKASPVPVPPPSPAPLPPTDSAMDIHDGILATLSQMSVSTGTESEIRNELKRILSEVTDPHLVVPVWTAVAGVFPVRDCLRHGTPEQRLFALIALGDRFFQGLAGLRWSGRQELIKKISQHLSEVSEGCSFMSMKNEPFHPQYHERVPGASSSGQIREMRGFLVVRRPGNQVVRLGRVWT